MFVKFFRTLCDAHARSHAQVSPPGDLSRSDKTGAGECAARLLHATDAFWRDCQYVVLVMLPLLLLSWFDASEHPDPTDWRFSQTVLALRICARGIYTLSWPACVRGQVA